MWWMDSGKTGLGLDVRLSLGLDVHLSRGGEETAYSPPTDGWEPLSGAALPQP